MKSAEDKKPHWIMEYIPVGAEHSIHMKTLGNLLHIDTRAVRSLIHAARLNGEIICGTNDGYFQPQTEEELDRWIRRAEASVKSTCIALHSAKRAKAEGRYPSAGALDD